MVNEPADIEYFPAKKPVNQTNVNLNITIPVDANQVRIIVDPGI
jgi:hypothetical protein